MKTLIIVDLQNDFMAGGPLEVPNAQMIVPIINAIQKEFDLVVATQDWHPENHKSFASNHQGKEPFTSIQWRETEQMLWPDHCVQGTTGAMFHSQLATNVIEAIFRKGVDPNIDSYSAFYDTKREKSTGLAGYLHDKGAQELFFCGLCADICVYFSIKDALAEGFSCCLVEDAVCALDEEAYQQIHAELASAGVRFTNSKSLCTS